MRNYSSELSLSAYSKFRIRGSMGQGTLLYESTEIPSEITAGQYSFVSILSSRQFTDNV